MKDYLLILLVCNLSVIATFLPVDGKCVRYSPPGADMSYTNCFTSVGVELANTPQEINADFVTTKGEILKSFDVPRGRRLIVIVHGFFNTIDQRWGREPGSQLPSNLQKMSPDSQIIFVDWSKGAAPWGAYLSPDNALQPYATPAANTRIVGWMMAKFFESSPNFNASSTWCIGFSLGAHACGFFGKSLWQGAKLQRITALDPADRLFDTSDSNERLDKSDATFVDVIHTSPFGLLRPMGHSDFYVNDPTKPQPECVEEQIPEGRDEEQKKTFEIPLRRRKRQIGVGESYLISGLVSLAGSIIKSVMNDGEEDVNIRLSWSEKYKSYRDVISGTIAEFTKAEEKELNEKMCSHAMSIELFAASCSRECSFRYCPCRKLNGYSKAQFRYQRRDCPRTCSDGTVHLLGYPAVLTAKRTTDHLLTGTHICEEGDWAVSRRRRRRKRALANNQSKKICYLFTAKEIKIRTVATGEESLVLEQVALPNEPKACAEKASNTSFLFSLETRDGVEMFTIDHWAEYYRNCFKICGIYPFQVPKISRFVCDRQQVYSVLNGQIIATVSGLQVQAYRGDEMLSLKEYQCPEPGNTLLWPPETIWCFVIMTLCVLIVCFLMRLLLFSAGKGKLFCCSTLPKNGKSC